MSSHIGLRSAAATDLIAAVAAGDFERAAALLPLLQGPQCDDAWKAVAEVQTVAQRWEDVVEALEHVQCPDDATLSRLRLSKNLSALKIHRPQTYRSVIDAEPATMFRLHDCAGGQKTIVYQPAGQPPKFYSTNPVATVKGAMQQLQPLLAKGQPLALLSIGDGHLLSALAANPPKLFMDRQQPIYVFEPDARLLLVNLLLHDFTGPRGPIEQPRVQWYVGPHWAKAFRLDALTDRYLQFPTANVKLAADPQPIEAELQLILADLHHADQASKKQIDEHYAPLTADDFRHAISGDFGRPPRIMLLTTRLSTVLQYATRDTADAFRKIGWDVQILIEPTPHHGMSRIAIRRTLAEFKPDVIFQIDHHRFEHGDLMPENIPFVNWIQDLLPHLMKPETGAKLGQRDYTLAPSRQRWLDEYTYPPRQTLEFRKLTRIPERPMGWHPRPEILTYVSNWSRTPETAKADILKNKTGAEYEVLAAACDQMIATYAVGGSLPTGGDVRRVLVDVLARLEYAIPEALLRQLSSDLFDRFANLLHRQQGLRWAAAACGKLGLKLQIFGNGWESNPEFARYGQGKIGYGDDLEEMTRRSGVSLVLEPFVCTMHQRMLDALAAGGFCLMRANPPEKTIESMISLIERAGRDVNNFNELAAALSPADRAELEETRRRGDALDLSGGGVDQIAIVRQLQRIGFLPTHGPIMPLLDQTQFDSAEELETRLARYCRDPELASTIARTQRQAVEQRYGYTAGVKQIVDFITHCLADENPARKLAA